MRVGEGLIYISISISIAIVYNEVCMYVLHESPTLPPFFFVFGGGILRFSLLSCELDWIGLG